MINIGNRIRIIRSLGLETLTILRVVEITHSVSKIFQLQPLLQQVFHPFKIRYDKKVRDQALSLRIVFQEPTLTPLSLCMVRNIHASASYERKDVLGALTLVTS